MDDGNRSTGAAQGARERTPIVIDARKVGSGEIKGATGDFTFTVEIDRGPPPPPDSTSPSDRRRSPRKRTRLRSGKIVDEKGRFLTECLFHDMSTQGGRIRLASGIGLPRSVQIYDDQTGTLSPARVLWRRGRDAGLALGPVADDARSRAIAADMRRKFYAVRD